MVERNDEPRAPRTAATSGRGSVLIPLVIGSGVIVVLLLGGVLVWHAESKTNKIALAASPKPVTVVASKAVPYRPERAYVGTLRPWIEAKVGPQFISAYVETVLVRPGSVVKKGQVLATLDCRNANAQTAALAAQARAISSRQQALSHEAARTQALLDGGFVSPNEAEQKTAQSNSQAAELAAEEANLTKSGLDVSDCILRAPFDGEVSLRLADPGAFARPGTEMIGVVDRSTIRMTADAPESDFENVAAGTKVTVHLVATNKDVDATITRRAPSADPGTRTVHFEIDLADPERKMPVDTTGEVYVPVGLPVPATSMPLSAVSMNDKKATFYTIDGDIAHQHTIVELGEVGPDVYFAPALIAAGSMIVVEGRALLREGDRVVATTSKVEPTGIAGEVVQGAHTEGESQ
jgi:RND family efflux transporter MFP subunit